MANVIIVKLLQTLILVIQMEIFHRFPIFYKKVSNLNSTILYNEQNLYIKKNIENIEMSIMKTKIPVYMVLLALELLPVNVL